MGDSRQAREVFEASLSTVCSAMHAVCCSGQGFLPSSLMWGHDIAALRLAVKQIAATHHLILHPPPTTSSMH